MKKRPSKRGSRASLARLHIVVSSIIVYCPLAEQAYLDGSISGQHHIQVFPGHWQVVFGHG
jgi:hypothetical protein